MSVLHTHVILLPGWSWDTPNSMKPLILTFLWVKFDSCCGASPPQPPSSLYMDGYSTAAVYGYFLPVTIGFTQQLKVSRQFNMSVFQVLWRRMRLHVDDDAVFSCIQRGLCRYYSQLNINTTDLKRGKTDTKHKADMDAPWVKAEIKQEFHFVY